MGSKRSSERNRSFYDQNARAFFARTHDLDMTHLYEPFLTRVRSGGRILDAGCGSGRDLKAFEQRGFEVVGIDASENMAQLARQHAGAVVHHLRFQDVAWRDEFDGVWACASLLHVPRPELPGVLTLLAAALRPGGFLYMSFKLGTAERLANGRMFTDLDREGLDELLAVVGVLVPVEVWITRRVQAGREGERWLNAVVRKPSEEDANALHVEEIMTTPAASEIRPLTGRVAIVTGASRGAGRGIALELGAAGATVYVTGRSTRAAPPSGYERFLAHLDLTSAPGDIETTAADVTELGGYGIAIRCDHTVDADVSSLFERVEREEGRLDILVNNAWGGHQNPIEPGPFWEQPLEHWDGMFAAGVRNHFLTMRHAGPLLVRQRSGLVVTTTFWDRDRYTGTLYYDVAKAALTRLAFGLAEELRPQGVASLAVSPGWMRTEFVLRSFDTDEEHWGEVAALEGTESPRYVGRAVVALACDEQVMAKTGGVYRVGDLALEYGFTDVDGRQVPAYEMPDGHSE